jgi:hypothetical protein
MSEMWLLGIAAVGLVAALVVRRWLSRASSTSDVDLGSVTERWLAEHKARKD